MAVLGSILFNRTLRQFLDCENLDSPKGAALVEKLRDSAKGSLDRLVEVIPETSAPHSEILKKICRDQAEDGSEDLFIGKLDDDATDVRSTAAAILAKTGQLNPAKLFKKLHEPGASRTEIIEILFFQRQNLKPEQIISNALKLDRDHAEQLLKLVADSKLPLDMSMLRVDPAAVESPTLKILLLRYFAQVKQPEVAALIARFLTDKNHTVVIEALKSLRDLPVRFDASVLLPHIDSLTEVEREIAFETLRVHADEDLGPRLAPFTCGKSDELREKLIGLFADHVTQAGLEEFLKRLEPQEWWGRDQALKCLQKLSTPKLTAAAGGLTSHKNEFIRDQAQQLATRSGNVSDIRQLKENALHENWQVRESALEAIGNSGDKESLELLKKVVDKYPDSAVSALKATARLGQSKGLELAFACLRMPEAQVQREALETVGMLANKRHAQLIRDKLMQRVPELQATVRDTAGEVVARMTKEFELAPINVDQATYFDTRSTTYEHTPVEKQGSGPTPVVQEGVSSMEDLKPGDLWMERYRIDREIGRGAMGRVMLAMDEMVDEPLILKYMHPELTADNASRERFLREVKYSRKVSHPNVIRIHDMLIRNNLSAISMEYFESRGLDEILREKKYIEVDPGLDILLQVANGMAAAHSQQVIHRDLKPSNILMNEAGLVKIVDFGIASVSSQSDSTLTKTGSIIGTPAYLSPERARGQDADERSDIYALGIIAYAMFCGRLPYTGEPMALLFQHLEGNAKPVHEIKPEVGARVSLLVQKMMAVALEDRLQTMEDVAEAIVGLQKKSA